VWQCHADERDRFRERVSPVKGGIADVTAYLSARLLRWRLSQRQPFQSEDSEESDDGILECPYAEMETEPEAHLEWSTALGVDAEKLEGEH
jgi:hypothetical protein